MARSKSEAKRVAVLKAPKAPTAKMLADKADEYHTTREQRLAIEKQAKALQKQETELKNWLIDNIPKSEVTGVTGKLVRVSIVRKEKPAAEDWPALYAHMQETGEFDLVQRRVSETAVRARWEDGKDVPGVGHFHYVDVSVNKV